jgi:hypothetical protein
MAFIPSESPNIQVREIDLSGVVPAVTTSTGAFVGEFNWGPVKQPVLVGNEAELAINFGNPSIDAAANAQDFLSAAAFLKYSSNAYITRVVGTGSLNASTGTAVLVENREDFDSKTVTGIIAKYPGTVGNSLAFYVADSSTFSGWVDGASNPLETYFDGAPTGDEVHIAVVDSDGVISGVTGTVLETFAYVSTVQGAKKDDGSTNYANDVLNNRSQYLWVKSGTALSSGGLSGGVSASPSVSDYRIGFDQYEDEDTIQVDFLVSPGLNAADNAGLVNYMTGLAAARKDCVVVASPARDEVVGVNDTTDIVDAVVTWANSLNASSYLIIDNNYVKVYDKYNDEYVYIPAAPMTAGVMAATDDVAAPWFSPAGSRRGQYFGVTSLAYNATKSQRDTLYKASVNPIVNLPGQGILLYGDKTKLGRPSAFDRINVRRLFLGIERAIKGAAQNVMFEFNDEFTRAEFVNIVEPFLREIKGRRGITDFRVVCDETNNTPSVIDANRFVASVFVKPARSINYVTLNFVAVRTGVDFDEIVGTV